MSETILVTGATGTVGSELVRDLANRGATVRAGVHSLIKGDRLKHLNPDVQLVELDFNRPETLAPAFTGVDRVFLLTPFSDEQVATAKKLIDAARAAGVRQVVRLSAMGAEAEPGIQLGRWHREVENYLEQSGLPYVVLRPSSFMQNFITYHAQSICEQHAIYLPLGEGRIGYVDTQDIAAAAGAILTADIDQHNGQVYTLTGPDALTVGDVAQAIGEATGQPVQYVNVPEEAARQAMQGAPEWMVDGMAELNAIGKAGYSADLTSDVEQLTERPPRTIQEFAHDNRHLFVQ